MKNLKILLFVLFMSVPALAIAADGQDEGKVDLITWLTGGAGISFIGGIVVWARKNFKNVFKKIKDLIDVPIAVAKGLSRVSTEVAQASASANNILQTIQNMAQYEDMTIKDFLDKFDGQIEDVKREVSDIPRVIDVASENIMKEINDLTKAQK